MQARHKDSLYAGQVRNQFHIAPLRGKYPKDVVDALEPTFQNLVYGDKADKGKKSRQTLLLGQPELRDRYRGWCSTYIERLTS